MELVWMALEGVVVLAIAAYAAAAFGLGALMLRGGQTAMGVCLIVSAILYPSLALWLWID